MVYSYSATRAIMQYIALIIAHAVIKLDIRSIPYENTSILQKLLKYINDDPSVLEDKAVQSY